jgi:ribosomal protein L22
VTPDKPQDPEKGIVDETTPEEAQASAETAAVEEAQVEATAEAPAEEAAPEETSTEETDAENVVAEGEPAPEGGAVAEAAQAKRKRTPKTSKKAEGTAAETTGVDKAAAEAAPSEKKPARSRARRTKPQDEEKAATSVTPARRRKRGEQPDVLVRAQAKYVRTSARKARLVCDHIRGKSVAEARAILAFTPRAVAQDWIKVLESAVANAEHNHELIGEDLLVHSVYADEGPTLKRFRPRAMGRATRIRKRTAHLTIELTPKES